MTFTVLWSGRGTLQSESASILTMTAGSSLETLYYRLASGSGVVIFPQSASLDPNFKGSGLVTG